MKAYFCDVCKNEVKPEELRYFVYGVLRSNPALLSPSLMKSVEGHDGCIFSLVEAMPS